MNKKRVLFLVNHEVVIYNFRREIVESLLEEGCDVIISSPYGKRIDFLVEMGCEYEEVNFDRHGTSIIGDIKLINYYKALIKKVKPDIVLTFTIKPNIYGGIAATRLGIPFVANITGLGTAVERKGLLQVITVMLYKYAFRKIKCVFFQNEENQQFFIDKKIARGKGKLLPGSGVNLEHFRPLPYPSGDTIEFVFISRIMKEKGIDLYLEAAQYIRKKYTNTKFHICGFCEEEYEDILKEYNDKGIVFYHGMVDDVREILKITHCTVHPSYYPEGMSNVLLESAACARPLITTDRSGCREVVTAGYNGYLVKSNSISDLLTVIDLFYKLSHEEQVRFGENSRRLVKRSFDREIIVKAYINEVINV